MEHFILMSDVKKVQPGERDKVSADLKNVTGVINRLHKKNLITPFDLVMEDEFQGITNNLQASLEMIFDIEECIIENNLGFKLRHVLYHDTIDSLQTKHMAYERLGFGLIDARERLKTIKKTESRFLIVTSNEKQSLTLNNLFLIYEDYVDSWKYSEYEYVTAFLNHKTYKEVAEQFGINMSNGWRREKNLKMKQYYTIKEMILSVTGA